MAAMMFPAMIPVVLFYNKVATKVEPNPALASAVGTPLFLMGYLLVYAGLGLCAYVAVFLALEAGASIQALAALGFLVPSIVLIIAGLYQVSPLKKACLSNCVSPFTFFSVHSHRGLTGSLRMGISHGRYCVGCCWAYMLVMLGVAAMSLPAMAVLAAVITLEKVIVRGAQWFTWAVTVGFVLLGVALLVAPGPLPT
jgi:predicted metal-binding membrane protein